MRQPLSVFGGTGFIGSEFCKQFGNVFVQPRRDRTPNFDDFISFISTIDNYNVFGSPHLDVETNINILLDILTKSKIYHPDGVTFRYVSSWFVYGKPTALPVREDAQCNPTGFYSITKRTAEQLLMSWCGTFPQNQYQIFRMAGVLGIGDTKISLKKNALQFLIREIVQGRDVEIYEDASIRDFIDVRDAARALTICIDGGELNEIYNIGNGIPLSVKDLIYYAHTKSKSSATITEIPVPNFHKTVQTKDFFFDISKLSKLGYKPLYSIYDTIDELIEHFQRGNEF